MPEVYVSKLNFTYLNRDKSHEICLIFLLFTLVADEQIDQLEF